MLCHVKNNRNITIIVVDYPLCKMDFFFSGTQHLNVLVVTEKQGVYLHTILAVTESL